MIIRDFYTNLNKNSVLKAALGKWDKNTEKLYEYMLPFFYSIIDPVGEIKYKDCHAFAAYTIGSTIDDVINKKFSSGDYMEGIILDAMASNFVFSMGDYLGEVIHKEYEKIGHKMSHKQFPLDDADKESLSYIVTETGIGITLSSYYVMEPVKSGAFMVFPGDSKDIRSCENCHYDNCLYRRGDKFGLAVDLGSSTVAVDLINMGTGAVIGSRLFINGQRKFGIDIISRISASKIHLKELNRLIRQELMENIIVLIEKESISFSDINNMVISGNTAMAHLLLERDCSGLAVYPFNSQEIVEGEFSFREIFHEDLLNCNVFITPSLAGFVGGDITAGIVFMDTISSNYLLVDLGTNSEIVLRHGDNYYTCSAAAGPAFERGRGQSASQVIELVARLVENGFLDESGLLSDSYYKYQGVYGFRQKDIRRIQLAKAAIAAGIDIVMKNAAVTYNQIDKLVLSGGMGSALGISSACKIGIIPSELAEKSVLMKNTSLSGSRLLVKSNIFKEKATCIKESLKYINLSDDKSFEDLFIKNMSFTNL